MKLLYHTGQTWSLRPSRADPARTTELQPRIRRLLKHGFQALCLDRPVACRIHGSDGSTGRRRVRGGDASEAPLFREEKHQEN